MHIYEEDYWKKLGTVLGQDDPDTTPQRPVYEGIAKLVVSKEAKRVFDFGCNFGRLEYFLRKAGFTGSYKGYDANPRAVELGQSRGLDIEEGAIRWMNIHGWSLELTVMKDMLEHQKDLSAFQKVLGFTRRWCIVSSFLPWTAEPTQVVYDNAGYYMNIFNEAEVFEAAKEKRFRPEKQVEIIDFNGNRNIITVFGYVNK